MNQILDYNPNKSSGGGSSGSDKVVRVFAVILACFAICLLAGGAYGIYKNKVKTEETVEAPTQAKITVEQGETTATIKVSHDKAIEKLIYSWDSGKENNIKGSGESSMESEISLISGTHTLTIKVTDIDGVETTYEEEITSENGEDKIYPVISLEITDEKKLKITATDETAIDFVTYRWNDGEEERVEVSEDDDKKIEFEIEILKGQNDLLIVAVDKNNNSTTESKAFTGVTRPDVTITISADKKSAEVYCYHENGLKQIKLKVNDVEYDVGLGEEETPKEVTFTTESIGEFEGNTNIVVTALSVDDTETEASEEIVQDEEEEIITIEIEKTEEDSEFAKATINAPSGIKEIKLNINDVDYGVDLQGENPVDTTLDNIPLPIEGNNKIILKVISMDGNEKEEVKEITR